MVNVIIFSRNRGCQLELLLRSMKKFFVEWSMVPIGILYTYTEEKYRIGYEKTKFYHPEFYYMLEEPGKFKVQTLSLINPKHQATIFFVDDIVFKSPFTFKSAPVVKFLECPNIACVSLRLCPRINYCYTEKRDTPPPEFSKDFAWFWRGKGLKGDWAYPQSLDGQIFRTEDILPLINRLTYENPNTLEGNLANHPFIGKDYMICGSESVIFNIPVNKVQTANGNHCGNIPADYLNDEFLKGKRISLSNLEHVKNMSCHQEMPLILEDSMPHTSDALVDIISKNKINYSGVVSDSRFYKSIKEEPSDITMLIPVKDRIGFLKPSVHYIKEAQKSSTYKIKLIYVENDSTPKFKEMCAESGVDYIFIPIDRCQSMGFFAKSLCYNIGFLLAPKTQWYIFHDLDILVDKDFFTKLSFYIQKNPRWVQSYTKKRVRLLSDIVTKKICSNDFIELSSLSDKNAPPATSGSTGGSILVRRDVFEEIGGYDPEIFFGYAPEDIFFWTKLEIMAKELNFINSCFQGGGLYADDPPIEVYHLNHKMMEFDNPHHIEMRSILASFWDYIYKDKMSIINFKKSILDSSKLKEC